MKKWWLNLLNSMAGSAESSRVEDLERKIERLEHQLEIKEGELYAQKVRNEMLESVTAVNLLMLDKVAAVHGRETQ